MSTKTFEFHGPTGEQTNEYAHVAMQMGDKFRGRVTMDANWKLKVSAGDETPANPYPRWMWLEREDGSVVWNETKATTVPTQTFKPGDFPPGTYYLCMDFSIEFNNPASGTSGPAGASGQSIIGVSYLKP